MLLEVKNIIDVIRPKQFTELAGKNYNMAILLGMMIMITKLTIEINESGKQESIKEKVTEKGIRYNVNKLDWNVGLEFLKTNDYAVLNEYIGYDYQARFMSDYRDNVNAQNVNMEKTNIILKGLKMEGLNTCAGVLNTDNMDLKRLLEALHITKIIFDNGDYYMINEDKRSCFKVDDLYQECNPCISKARLMEYERMQRNIDNMLAEIDRLSTDHYGDFTSKMRSMRKVNLYEQNSNYSVLID